LGLALAFNRRRASASRIRSRARRASAHDSRAARTVRAACSSSSRSRGDNKASDMAVSLV